MQNSNNIGSSKILVIGLGQLGLPVAKYIKDKGFDVYGYDINPIMMKNASNKIGLKTTSDFNSFDIYIICISTHQSDDIFSPNIDGIVSVAKKISLVAKDGALVSIESTIPKGTSRKIFELMDHRLHVVHAPHRWYSLEEKEHGVNQPRIIGGVSSCCLNKGLSFYDGRKELIDSSETISDSFISEKKSEFSTAENISSITVSNTNIQSQTDSLCIQNLEIYSSINKKCLEIPMHPVFTIEIAELTKIIENSHRYLQIAFAEDLYLYCSANSVSFHELRDALNTKWNVNILEPRDGIGGHCLPKDTKMFLSSSKSIKSKIIKAALEVNNDYINFRKYQGHKYSSSNITD